jgi:hypothetical protein
MEEPTFGSCNGNCLFPSVIAQGDTCGISTTGVRPANAGDLQAGFRTQSFIRKIIVNLNTPGVMLRKIRFACPDSSAAGGSRTAKSGP